ILFLIYLKPLFEVLEKKHPTLQFTSYIDDVGIISTGRTLTANVRELNSAARTVFQWAERNAVAFDDSKSELLHFTRSRSTAESDNQVTTLPNGTKVKPSQVLRWLGVWLDRKLSFQHHIKTKLGSAERALAAMSRLSTTEKGLTVAAVRQLYMSCVIPIADFGAEIWWKGQQGAADKLQKLQSKATRKILGAFCTTPVPLLDAEAALLPPSLRLTYAQRRMALRILTLDNYHPLTRRCPDSFHQMAEGVSQEELGGASWDEEESGQRKYPNSLVRILSTLKDWIKPASTVEVVNDDCGIKPAKIEFHISTSDKGTAA